MPARLTGQAPFVFSHCADLHTLPPVALAGERGLHGGFAIDKRPGYGQLYYGMPGAGLLRISADLTRQELLDLPPELRKVNFHSTKIGQFDGQMRLFLPANQEGYVAVVSLEGEVDFILSRPELDEYQSAELPYRPTDTALVGDLLLVTDGYGANYIAAADLETRRWQRIFGGKTENPNEHGRFGTAHGLNLAPDGRSVTIADRPHSRLELMTATGQWLASHALPAGSRPCGIDYHRRNDRWYAVIGSLDDPIQGRPAPIYILDVEGYQVISTLRPKEDLGIEPADHIHNVVWHEYSGRLFLVCQSWNPGHYFVLEMQ